MNDLDTHVALHRRRKAIEDLRALIGRESFLTVAQACDRMNVNRKVVEALPMEILPYSDFGRGVRSLRRYHPADVLAAPARLRAWKRAQDAGRGEAHLAELRAQLEARDEEALNLARSMNAELNVA